MDLDGFLADCRAQWSDFDDDEALGRAPYPRDRRLAGVPERVRGFATENKLMLLNLAVRHMDPDEAYVEVGTWRGLTVVGAAAGNPDADLFVCDDFSKLGGTRDALEQNIRAHCAPGQVRVHETDYRAFLQAAPWAPRKVGVYFYDGAHHYRHQFRALELIRPWLADDAVIVIDDTDDLPVRAANDLFRRHVAAFQPVLDIRSPAYKHPHWWNGLQVFRWQQNGAPARLPVSLHAYVPRFLLWNRGIVYGQRAAHYAREFGRRVAALLPGESRAGAARPRSPLQSDSR